jgi:hypothetical protein
MKNYLPEILAALGFCAGVFLVFHEWLNRCPTRAFEWEQFWSHETLIACCLVGIIALIAGKYLGRR